MPKVIRKVKNVVKNYSIPETKVRNATSNDSVFPSAMQLDELARYTYQHKSREEILRVLYKRINDRTKYWRHIYKSLIVLEYLSFHGHENVYRALKTMLPIVNALKSFIMIGDDGKDQGNYIRERAERVNRLVEDEDFYKSEKDKANASRAAMTNDSFGGLPNSMMGNHTFKQSSFTSNPQPPKQHKIPDYAPKTAEEESLQLQLALAISKEEANAVQNCSNSASQLSNDTGNTSTYDIFNMNQQSQQNTSNMTQSMDKIRPQTQQFDVFSDVFEYKVQSTGNVFNYGNQPQHMAPSQMNNNWTTTSNSNCPQQMYDTRAQQPFPQLPPLESNVQQPFPQLLAPGATAQSPFPQLTVQNSNEQQQFSQFSAFNDAPVSDATTHTSIHMPVHLTHSKNFDAFLQSESPFHSDDDLNTAERNKGASITTLSETTQPPVDETNLGDAFQFVQSSGLVEMNMLAALEERPKIYKQPMQAPTIKQLNANDTKTIANVSSGFMNTNANSAVFGGQSDFGTNPRNTSFGNYPPPAYIATSTFGQQFSQNVPQPNMAGSFTNFNQTNTNINPAQQSGQMTGYQQQPQPGTFGYSSSSQPQNRNNPFAD